MEFAKGHGTGNDFVVLPDPDGALELEPDAAKALCDRRFGIGGDGVLRVVPTAKVPGAEHLAAQAEWFMDYRNADGSVAEMCGNGIRVYARWLQKAGLVGDGELALATRDGVKRVLLDGDGDITVDMGAPRIVGAGRTVSVESGAHEGVEIWLGNPHVVVAVPDLAAAGPLTTAPGVHPELDTNVEFAVVGGPGEVAMRVHERGSGETLSCGTGACAVAVAASLWAGADHGRWGVTVRGGLLTVHWTGESVLLSGPAVIVASGVLT